MNEDINEARQWKFWPEMTRYFRYFDLQGNKLAALGPADGFPTGGLVILQRKEESPKSGNTTSKHAIAERAADIAGSAFRVVAGL